MNVKQNGKGVGKVRGGGEGAFDKLQKSRPVINQTRICPRIQDPEHLLGLWGSWASEEGFSSPAWEGGSPGAWAAQPFVGAKPSNGHVQGEVG